MEIWKDIEGYEGMYQVSNLGRVKSIKRFRKSGNGGYFQSTKILKTGIRNGYLHISLNKDGKQKTFKLHRLVAQHFIPNPENKPEIDHINTVKTDNRVENLRWCTHKENMNNPISKNNHSISMKGKPSLKGKEDSQSKSIIQYSLDGKFIKKWDSIMDVQRTLGLAHQNICNALKGRYSHCGGYKWKYAI